MTRTLISAITAILLTQSTATEATPIDCATLISSHINWIGASPNRRIGAKFARVKITSGAVGPIATKWGHVSFAEGAFGRAGDKMSGRFMVAFNDRGFDNNRRDITDITLWADGRGEIVLRSWGDAKLPLSDFRCDSAGFVSALEREGNGASLITIGLRRETF